MKKFLPRLTLALVMSVAMVALSSHANAQQPASDAQQSTTAQQQDDMQTQEAKPFNGTIMKEKGKLVLKDTAANVSYQLDDQEKARKFVGKQVRVTGKLDMNTNLIHVENIEELAS